MTLFYCISDYPEHLSAGSILTRFFDGLGFRFYWATEGLSDPEYRFRPREDCMSIEELIRHIWGLVNWINISISDEVFKRPEKTEEIIDQVLEIVYHLRELTLDLSEMDLKKIEINDRPFWHIINGPLSDVLTHVGQINSFRRLAGKPARGAKVFTGKPPTSEAEH
jgi:hypothetical protein